MASAAPIGVLDSGFGGLSVLRAIRALLPAEDLLYCADHAWLPYGDREPAVVRARVATVADALAGAGAKAVVIACNTATAAAAAYLRRVVDVPVVAMEPAVKPAARATRSGVVGVLGTGGTLASARFAGLLARYGDGLEVVTRPAPELVAAVERADDATRGPSVAQAVAPLLGRGADVIVLGCTHFAFLRPEVEAAAGPGVAVIDTGPAVARELGRRLAAHGLAAPPGRSGAARFWTSGDPSGHRAVVARLWGAAALERMPGAAARAAAGRD